MTRNSVAVEKYHLCTLRKNRISFLIATFIPFTLQIQTFLFFYFYLLVYLRNSTERKILPLVNKGLNCILSKHGIVCYTAREQLFLSKQELSVLLYVIYLIFVDFSGLNEVNEKIQTVKSEVNHTRERHVIFKIPF